MRRIVTAKEAMPIRKREKAGRALFQKHSEELFASNSASGAFGET